MRCALAAGLALLALAAAGCSPSPRHTTLDSNPTPAMARIAAPEIPDPVPDAADDFYPIGIGNRWSFERRFFGELFPADGGPAVPAFDMIFDAEVELVCEESRDGRTYVVEQTTLTSDTEEYVSWVRMRQDPAGLFEADVSSEIAPECAGAAARRGTRVMREGSGDPVAPALDAAFRDPARRAAVGA